MANRQPTPPKREAIDDFGLPHWIDSGRYKQNGYGWKDFDLFCSLDLPDTVIAKIFNKTNKTVKNWKQRRGSLDVSPPSEVPKEKQNGN